LARLFNVLGEATGLGHAILAIPIAVGIANIVWVATRKSRRRAHDKKKSSDRAGVMPPDP
jgi:hypothetical protein